MDVLLKKIKVCLSHYCEHYLNDDNSDGGNSEFGNSGYNNSDDDENNVNSVEVAELKG